MERKRLSLFPDAPPGADMFSRYIIYHCMSGNRSRRHSKLALFGNQFGQVIDPFGTTLAELSKVLPPQSVSAEYLLNHATLFRFYSTTLSFEVMNAWKDNQLKTKISPSADSSLGNVDSA